MNAIQQIEENTESIKNLTVAFDNMANTAETFKKHLFRMLDIIEAQIDEGDTSIHEDELDQYIQACYFARKYGRTTDRVSQANEIIDSRHTSDESVPRDWWSGGICDSH